MPNHVINEITIPNTELRDVGRFLSAPKSDTPIDFEVLVPPPTYFGAGDAGRHHKGAFPGTHLDDATERCDATWSACGGDEEGRYRSVF